MQMMGAQGAWLTRALDVAGHRQRLITENLANVSVPGYKAKDVSFEEEMGRAMIVEREGLVARQDGNNVTMEVERAESEKNFLAYRTWMTALNHEARLMTGAINGRMG